MPAMLPRTVALNFDVLAQAARLGIINFYVLAQAARRRIISFDVLALVASLGTVDLRNLPS